MAKENNFEFIQYATREYLEEYADLAEKALNNISDEVFYLLFQNREFLLWFNETVAFYNDFKMKRVYTGMGK